jgi:2-polyprenyl-6-hydroxyphenyl methylase / 3-demethylubiquinone-9 3-methyltransferase
MPSSTVSHAEVARFDALAARWWDPDGPMRPLHRMNPARVAWIAERMERSPPPPLAGGACPGLDPGGRGEGALLDIGCGAGIAAEAFARLGYRVTGLDAAGEAIEAARTHAARAGLPITYRIGAPEDLVAENLRFPVVTALEVIEHVADPAAFLATVADLLAPGGRLFLSTLNRTARSFLTAKIGAEYLLRWLPVGTHDWRRFITPVEMDRMLSQAGLRLTDVTGLTADPLTGRWITGRDLSVNYLLMASA